MYVDNAAMQLVRDPKQFDVIVTGNLFGDILSDEASMLAGSIGMLPSASLDANGKGLYEPIHGSAPDIAGQDKANPLATILSLAMMFRYTFARADVADRIERAVRAVLAAGHAHRRHRAAGRAGDRHARDGRRRRRGVAAGPLIRVGCVMQVSSTGFEISRRCAHARRTPACARRRRATKTTLKTT